ncbi:MAG: cytochrome c3 family protein, partial [Anaerolineales bacterium]|nr:cytochrome c3 family protein [Anaerolineales bacterium]
MQKRSKYLIFLVMLVGITLLIASCAPEVVTEEVVVTQEVEVTRVVTVEPAPPEPPEEEDMAEVMVEVPFMDFWESSGHADETAEAFRHWDEDDPPIIPASCAKCHSSFGYQDFLGLDGSEFGSVDSDHPIGSTVECVACHNDETLNMTTVVMPSGLEITAVGREARCMQCHQGRESKVSVDEAIASAGVDDDAVSEDLGFRNIHYFAAAATKYGTEAKGGYEYDGKTYDAFFAHVEEYESCETCHNAHTLELKVEECSACHEGVASAEDFKDVRMAGSLVDYNGNGDVEEGVYYELEGLREMLYGALQAYAAETAGTPLVYDSAAYPYFFIDTDEDGEVSEGEAAFPNAYNAWTPRLLRAAYNYQYVQKDPGA